VRTLATKCYLNRLSVVLEIGCEKANTDSTSPLNHNLCTLLRECVKSVRNITSLFYTYLHYVPQIHRITPLHPELCKDLDRQALTSISSVLDKIMNRFSSSGWNLSSASKQSHCVNTRGIRLVALILCGSSLCTPAGDWIANGLRRSTVCPHLVLYFPHHLTPVGNLSR
jgi:hypothetical protein